MFVSTLLFLCRPFLPFFLNFYLFIYYQWIKSVCYLCFQICFHSEKNSINPNDNFYWSRDLPGPCAGEQGMSSPEAICPQRWGPPWDRGQPQAGAQQAALPTAPLPFWGCCSWVQSGPAEGLPILIPRDKILPRCWIVKGTTAWVRSPEPCKPSVGGTGVLRR